MVHQPSSHYYRKTSPIPSTQHWGLYLAIDGDFILATDIKPVKSTPHVLLEPAWDFTSPSLRQLGQ